MVVAPTSRRTNSCRNIGGGVQILDPATEQFTTYDSKNSGLISDYVSSLAMGKDGRLLVSNSEGLSMLNLKAGKFDNIKGNRAGIAFRFQADKSSLSRLAWHHLVRYNVGACGL